jgi:hypothetical protein
MSIKFLISCILSFLWLALPTCAQPVGGDIYFYITDAHGKSLFLNKDSIIYFESIYQNKDYKIEVKGKKTDYGIVFDKNTQRQEGMFRISIHGHDSLSICITKKGKIGRKKMRILLPAISEGMPYMIRITFRPKRFRILPKIIEAEKEKQKAKMMIDLSFLFNKS